MGTKKCKLFEQLWPVLGNIARCDMSRVQETISPGKEQSARTSTPATASRSAPGARQPVSTAQCDASASARQPASAAPRSASASAVASGSKRSAREGTATSPNKQPRTVVSRKAAVPDHRSHAVAEAAADAAHAAVAAEPEDVEVAADVPHDNEGIHVSDTDVQPRVPSWARSQRQRKARQLDAAFYQGGDL